MQHAQSAADFDMDEGALRVAVHRMRKRYREMLKEEIAQTLSGPRRRSGRTTVALASTVAPRLGVHSLETDRFRK